MTRLDQKKIGIIGHSMGGCAAVQICRRDPRINAGVTLDAFLFGADAQKPFDKPLMFMLAGDGIKTFERSWDQNDWEKIGINSLDDEKIINHIICQHLNN